MRKDSRKKAFGNRQLASSPKRAAEMAVHRHLKQKMIKNSAKEKTTCVIIAIEQTGVNAHETTASLSRSFAKKNHNNLLRISMPGYLFQGERGSK